MIPQACDSCYHISTKWPANSESETESHNNRHNEATVNIKWERRSFKVKIGYLYFLPSKWKRSFLSHAVKEEGVILGADSPERLFECGCQKRTSRLLPDKWALLQYLYSMVTTLEQTKQSPRWQTTSIVFFHIVTFWSDCVYIPPSISWL